ncbi:HvfC family RiPP maturation protein [Zestomonas carbonaria]|uniref:DNA-binding domain-containing protein n=1 Tax=Zestomonas carbonaria TaxID=2762745 RepID=A0A7U7ER34_9GAMM|nr:putative DNA-binding domain-containing protein [Pseudomonas carbonaria]CAD5109531.1 hypothetical protein PSEWESI4_03836 [Pseudomonas carbonaria]
MPESLREQQYTLARHLRDPANNPPPPGIEPRRLKVYRELFFNSISGLLAGSFPVIRQTLSEAEWNSLVQAFYAGHRSRTPLFTEIASEFVAFLQGHSEQADIPPWLAELAHYEWVELALQLADANAPAHRADGDLLEGIPLLSPLALPLGYRWPVTDLGPGFKPAEAAGQPTLLLVHRDENHRVRFAQISPPAYRLLLSLSTNQWSGRQHLAALADEAGDDADGLQAQGLAMLEQLRSDGIVLGTLITGASS